MAKDYEPISPRDARLGSMQRHGVRGLFVASGGHERCCGKLGTTAVRNWIERADRLPGGLPACRMARKFSSAWSVVFVDRFIGIVLVSCSMLDM
jgi:hypothetical protein